VAHLREREALEAAGILGIETVEFLRLPDGEVENTVPLRGEIVERIRRWQPAAVFTHDPEHPEPPYIFHRDHRTVGRATLDAVYPAARDPLSYPEHLRAGLNPHAVADVWLFASEIATSFVDIRSGFDRKIAARLAHTSQTPDPSALPPSWRDRFARIGSAAGLELAETFTLLRL
jgi:LmbE family N-acetylglucosaminyl deacetylase